MISWPGWTISNRTPLTTSQMTTGGFIPKELC
jgi:hypothetical protein